MIAIHKNKYLISPFAEDGEMRKKIKYYVNSVFDLMQIDRQRLELYGTGVAFLFLEK